MEIHITSTTGAVETITAQDNDTLLSLRKRACLAFDDGSLPLWGTALTGASLGTPPAPEGELLSNTALCAGDTLTLAVHEAVAVPSSYPIGDNIVTCMRLSPCTRFLCVVTRCAAFTVYDTSTTSPLLHAPSAFDTAPSFNGSRLCIGSRVGNALEIHAVHGGAVRCYKGHRSRFKTEWCGERIFTASYDTSVKAWEETTGEILWSAEHITDGKGLAVTDRYVVCSEREGLVLLFRGSGSGLGSGLVAARVPARGIHNLRSGCDGRHVVSNDYVCVKVWDFGALVEASEGFVCEHHIDVANVTDVAVSRTTFVMRTKDRCTVRSLATAESLSVHKADSWGGADVSPSGTFLFIVQEDAIEVKQLQ